MREEREGRSGIGLLASGQSWAEPSVFLAIVDPDILQVLGLLGSILETTKQNDVVLHYLLVLTWSLWK